MRQGIAVGAILGVSLCLGFAIAAGWFDVSDRDAPANSVSDSDCDPSLFPCRIMLGPVHGTFRLGPPVSPLVPMPINLTIGGSPISDPIVEFSMRDMDMGSNRYGLLAAGAGLWQGQAILPICSAARLDWLVTLSFTVDHDRRALRFAFSTVP